MHVHVKSASKRVINAFRTNVAYNFYGQLTPQSFSLDLHLRRLDRNVLQVLIISGLGYLILIDQAYVLMLILIDGQFHAIVLLKSSNWSRHETSAEYPYLHRLYVYPFICTEWANCNFWLCSRHMARNVSDCCRMLFSYAADLFDDSTSASSSLMTDQREWAHYV